MRSFASLVACMACINMVPSATSSAPAAVRDIRYEITADSATLAQGKLRVAMTMHVTSRDPVRLSLPAWLPGAYELLWFARQVSAFSAESNGTPLGWRRADPQTWEIHPTRTGEVRVSFDYAIDGIAHSNASQAADFLYFSGAPFLYPLGEEFTWSARVFVRTEPRWRVMSDLHTSGSPNAFVASDYHDLVDAPFYVGRFDADSSRIGDRWLRFAAHPVGTITPNRRDETMRLFESLIGEDSAIIGDVPFRDYTVFLLADSGTPGGGIEHLDSQVSAVPPARLDSRDLRVIYSHELFHAWNVKRLRPREMTPYRYDRAQPSTQLWISEGVTEYYAVTTLARRVPADSSIVREYLARWIFMTNAAPPVALSDASVSTWVDGPGINYMKGPLAAFLIDVLIRDASDNARSLDDAMRLLYATTATRGEGFTRDDWWDAVAQSAGGADARARFGRFAPRHIDGREPLPVDSIFALAGLRVERRSVVPDPAASAKALRIRQSLRAN